jgi:predicted Zn-dependent protease
MNRRRFCCLACANVATAATVGATLATAVSVPLRAAHAAPGGIELLRDDETESLIRNFADPLFRAAGIDPGLVRILLVRDDEINSFVTTGNRMVLFSGMIRASERASEVVGVIAHETGHIFEGHLVQLPEMIRHAYMQAIAGLLASAAAGIATGNGGAAVAGALGSQQLATRNLLAYTRDMEAQADAAAMRFLDALHWSAAGFRDLLDSLKGEESLITADQDPYVQTHPLTADRIEYVAHHVATSPWSNAPLPAGLDARYALARAKLAAFLTPSSTTLARVKPTDTTAPARYARAIALYRLGHTAEALSLLRGLEAQDPGNPWYRELEGQVLFDAGRPREALAPYQEALRLAPSATLVRGALARAMIETGDPALLRPAVTQLQIALAAAPDQAEFWRAMSEAQGKLGNTGEAQLAAAEAALTTGDIPRANGFAIEARKHLPQGPDRLRADDISNATKKENLEGF